jgi:tetratricopeptide (TPR) repeat protein
MPKAMGPTGLRARGLFAASILADAQANHELTCKLMEEASTIYRELGDRKGVLTMVNALGIHAQHQGDYSKARSLFEEAVSLGMQLQDQTTVELALSNVASIAKALGNYEAARAIYDRSWRVFCQKVIGARRPRP